MGKGSSKGHTPREAKDNLKSTQLLSVIDAISEGPVEGPVDGLKSVLLNSTPVLDSEGNTNISGVTVVFRAGEQEQTPPEGFESSGSETVLGTEVKYDTPITRTITSANIDRLRFTFGVQALVETTSKGDRNPSEVRLLVQIQRNGGWVTEKDITIKGKTTSQYLASVVVDNLPPRPFNIRMRRMTPDSTTDQLQNKTLWSSYTEIIDVKQCYPNTALVGVQVDSEQFGSQQVSRNYHLRGRILQVPSNYNPQTRQYSGIWDGTFKPAYSNNMAWCLWDMLTHPRYGMGKRLGAADVDKWALYVIGQYCDQSVPDGFGGTEPRITCNAYLTTQRKAWDVLSDFCSAMRCMPVWNGQTLTFVQDRPSDKVWTYNRSNVVMPDDGAPFRYSFSALKDRHNAVEVNWIDPNNGWETATELVEDTQAIARYGRNVTKMDAFGCTSRGQAHRAGLWLIKTELLETQTVDFSVGAEGLRHVHACAGAGEGQSGGVRREGRVRFRRVLDAVSLDGWHGGGVDGGRAKEALDLPAVQDAAAQGLGAGVPHEGDAHVHGHLRAFGDHRVRGGAGADLADHRRAADERRPSVGAHRVHVAFGPEPLVRAREGAGLHGGHPAGADGPFGGVPGEIDVEPAVLAGGGSDRRAAVLLLLPDHHHAVRELLAARGAAARGHRRRGGHRHAAVHHHHQHARQGRDVGRAVHPADLSAAVRMRVRDDGGHRGRGRICGHHADVVGACGRLRRDHDPRIVGSVRFRD
mgnify:CR=1 FL=1